MVIEKILKNENKKLILETMSFIVDFYELIGLNYHFDFSEYFRTVEKALSADPKFLSTKFLSKKINTQLTNPLLRIELINYSVSLFFHLQKKKKLNNS